MANLPDDWWVEGHRKRIAEKRRAWRDATRWKRDLSDPETRIAHITSLPLAVSHENSTKISRWYRRMVKCNFMFEWVWSQMGVLECSGAAKMITDDYLKKMDSEYKKFINS
mgnify:FL=1